MERRTCRVAEAAALLGISWTAAYDAIARNSFPVRVIRVGRAIRVPLEPLRRLLAGQPSLREEC